MRIINNNLGIQINDKARNEGAPANANQKLIDLLMSSDQRSMVLEGQLLGKAENMVKLQLPKLGIVEVSLNQGTTTLPEGSQVSVKLTLSEGEITAELKPLVDESAVVTKSKASDQLLSKLNLPLTKSNQDAAELLIQYKIEPSAEKIKQLAEGSFLASKIREQMDQPEMNKALSRLVEAIELEQPERIKAENMPNLSLKKIVVELVQMTEQTTNLNENHLKPEETGKALGALSSAKKQSEPTLETQERNLSESKTPTEESIQSIKRALIGLDAKKILALMSLGENLEVDQLQRLKNSFGSEEGQIHLKHKLLDQLKEQLGSKTPSQAFKNALEAWVNDSGNKMDVRALNSLETLLKESEPQLYSAMKENIEGVRSLSTLIEQLPQQVYGLQIPVLIDQQESQLEIYVNRKKSKKANDGFKMLLALQTESFDQVQILVSDYQQRLTVEFKVSDEQTLKAFESELDFLRSDLRQVSPQPVEVRVGLKFDEPTVLTVLGFMGKDGSSQIDARV